MQLCLAKLAPENEDFPYQEAVMSLEFEEKVAEKPRQLPPETISVETLITT